MRVALTKFKHLSDVLKVFITEVSFLLKCFINSGADFFEISLYGLQFWQNLIVQIVVNLQKK